MNKFPDKQAVALIVGASLWAFGAICVTAVAVAAATLECFCLWGCSCS